jgi:flagellar motility protein MotE (MotC chaperone)
MRAVAQHWPTKGRRLLAAVLGAIAAMAAAHAVSSLPAQAQQGWEPVIVANAPAQDPAYAIDTPSPRPRRPLRPAAAPPSPAPAPVPARRSEAMPALTTIAAQTVAAAAGGRPAAELPEAEARTARDYCKNIADAAADARFAWQKKTLADLEQEVAKRVVLLEERTAEYQRWLARRDEFSKKARDSVVTIYARMRPDAAAAQLVAMDEETAAAVLTKLDPRNASAILNEMDATQAARLTATIGGAANVGLPARPKAQAGEKKS